MFFRRFLTVLSDNDLFSFYYAQSHERRYLWANLPTKLWTRKAWLLFFLFCLIHFKINVLSNNESATCSFRIPPPNPSHLPSCFTAPHHCCIRIEMQINRQSIYSVLRIRPLLRTLSCVTDAAQLQY